MSFRKAIFGLNRISAHALYVQEQPHGMVER